MANLVQKFGQWLAGKSISQDATAWVNGSDVTDSDQGAKMVSPYLQSAWVYVAVSVLAESMSQIPFRISRTGTEAARRVRALGGAGRALSVERRGGGGRGRGSEPLRRALWENIVDSGPAVDLFEKPHPTMDKTLFWEQLISWDALRGEFFILPLDASDGPVDLTDRKPQVARMITLAPDLFWHQVVGFDLLGWRYTGSPLQSPLPSETLSTGEVIHSRNVNPYLFWRGMSPLLVAMLAASADYAAAMFQKGLLMNNADTGVIVTTDQQLTTEQREQFVTALRERKRKAGTPDRPLMLSSGVKVEKPTISNVDMQFLETRKLLRQEIGAIFKVPESLMGFSESKSGLGSSGVLDGEKHSFVEQTLAARCHRAETAVAPIVRTFGDDLVGWFDIEGLPVMQEARRARVDSATKVFAMGVSFNEINRVYDLGFGVLPWGDKGYLPFNLQDAAALAEPMPAEDEPGRPDPNAGDQKPADGKPQDSNLKPQDEGKLFSRAAFLLANFEHPTSNVQLRTIEQLKADSKRLWEAHVRRRLGTVKLFESKVKRVLNEFRGKTLAKLAEVHLETLNLELRTLNLEREKGEELPQKNAEITQRGLIDLIFNAHEFGNALKVILRTPMLNGLQDAGQQARSEIGVDDPWTMAPKKASEYVLGREQKILGVGGTVRDQLNTTIEQGVQAGETHQELADRIRDTFNRLSNGGEEMTVPESRRVAMTEVNQMFNFARHDAFDDAGIEYKSWLSSHGPRVREGHAEAEEVYADAPIRLNAPFEVRSEQGDMEEMMFPGDDSLGASAGNIINCQCIQLAAVKTGEDEEGKRVRFKIFGLGEVWFAA